MELSSNPNPTPTPIPESDFPKVVAESREAIHSAEQKPVAKARGRGRPRKVPDAAQTAQPSATANPLAAPNTAPDISEYIVGPLIAVSTIPARRTNVPELALTKDEALACAKSLNQILIVLAPQGVMSPLQSAIFGAAITFGSIGITKYQIYIEKSTPPPAPVPETKTELSEKVEQGESVFPVYDSRNFIGRKEPTQQ